jgi:hypothetical protein
MKDIPQQLECSYCIRNRTHGGECGSEKSYYDPNTCLIFKADERGCIRNKDSGLYFPLYHDIPLLNTWCNDWQINGVDTSIRINRIQGLKWDSKKGNLVVLCNFDYFINEYHEDYKEPRGKSILKIVK